MEIDNNFKTDDIGLTSFLLTQEITLIDIVEDAPNHFSFLLANPNKCDLLKHDFMNGELAPARELLSYREMLITEIKTRRHNGNRK
ncbi:MAG TPA: hypothetical protein VMR59_03945 [Patescibacteria group bacterium]|nr:hypothetical protein [Patescibacteria group bacterium]